MMFANGLKQQPVSETWKPDIVQSNRIANEDYGLWDYVPCSFVIYMHIYV